MRKLLLIPAALFLILSRVIAGIGYVADILVITSYRICVVSSYNLFKLATGSER